MANRKGSHYDRLYVLRRRRIKLAIASGNARAAYVEAPHLYPGDLTASSPPVLCWQCGEPLATCGPNRNGRNRNGTPASWDTGHTVDGNNSAPLVPECSPCNRSRGAAAGNRRRPPSHRRRGVGASRSR